MKIPQAYVCTLASSFYQFACDFKCFRKVGRERFSKYKKLWNIRCNFEANKILISTKWGIKWRLSFSKLTNFVLLLMISYKISCFFSPSTINIRMLDIQTIMTVDFFYIDNHCTMNLFNKNVPWMLLKQSQFDWANESATTLSKCWMWIFVFVLLSRLKLWDQTML